MRVTFLLLTWVKYNIETRTVIKHRHARYIRHKHHPTSNHANMNKHVQCDTMIHFC